jgi:phi13 family phage major tail protein
MAENTVKFGFSNVYVAFQTDNGFDTPIAIPGGVNVALDLDGSDNTFYADNGKYWVYFNNNGYTGTMEVANFPQAVLNEALGWYVDVNGNSVEDADGKQKKFALLFQVDGDNENNRTVFYDCKISRPSINAQTTEEDVTPQTDSVDLTISPYKFESLDKKVVKLVCPQSSDSYAGFNQSVVLPDVPVDETPSVTVSPSRIGLGVNESRKLNAATVPAGATVTWTSSADATAEVDERGVVTGKAAGTATINATITVNTVDYTDTCTVVVSA